jgi:hypothetical protein
MQNLSKSHEKNVQTAVHGEQVSNILDNVENVPYALRGSTVKSILYWLFCTIAALELSAALFFYVASLGTPQAVAAVMAGVIGFALHGLLHALLTDTTKGMVFSKKRESKAMSQEVKVNILLSIVLLVTVALIVFFVGKKGFTAYRGHQYEIAQAEATGKAGPDKPLGITADMLVNKKGKISSDKLEQLAAVTTATAKAADSKTASVTADRQAYDSTTAQMTDIVGASAFVLELLLALLAYSIATAKYAAVFDEIARRNGASQPQSQQAAQMVTPTTPQSNPSVTPQAASQQASPTATTTEPNQQAATPTNEKKGITQRFNEYTVNDQNAITEKLKQDLERDMFYFSVEQIKAYLSRVNGLITIVSDATTQTIKFHSPIVTDEITASVTPPTTQQTQQKQIGFSDNRTPKNTAQTAVTAAKSPNEGRVIIKGFQRQNAEKTDNLTAVTAAVTTAVTAEKIGTCKRCDNEFEKTVYNKKFCCEDCKILFWQEKNGKLLRKGTAVKV